MVKERAPVDLNKKRWKNLDIFHWLKKNKTFTVSVFVLIISVLTLISSEKTGKSIEELKESIAPNPNMSIEIIGWRENKSDITDYWCVIFDCIPSPYTDDVKFSQKKKYDVLYPVVSIGDNRAKNVYLSIYCPGLYIDGAGVEKGKPVSVDFRNSNGITFSFEEFTNLNPPHIALIGHPIDESSKYEPRDCKATYNAEFIKTTEITPNHIFFSSSGRV